MNFSALNVDFRSPSPDLYRFKEICARGREKGAFLYKVVISPLLARLACKRLQIGTDTLFIITNTSDELLSSALLYR